MSKKNLPIAFISRSAPFVAQKIAELYGMHFFRWKRTFQHMDKKAIKKPMNLFIIGLYCKGGFEHVLMQYVYLSSYFNKTIIVFAGTDLTQLKKLSSTERRRLFKALIKHNTKFYAVGEYAQQEAEECLPELKSLNTPIGVLYFPLQHKMPNKLPPMPKRFKVGCYMPPSAADFYGFELIREASKLVPDVTFHMYSLQGADRKEYSLPRGSYKNIICHPRLIRSEEMSKFISKMSCGLRVVKHDGNPMSLAEYNIMGRWFIYNKEMPYCDFLNQRNPGKLAKLINKVKNRTKRSIDLNHKGSSFYKERHDKDNFFRIMMNIYKG